MDFKRKYLFYLDDLLTEREKSLDQELIVADPNRLNLLTYKVKDRFAYKISKDFLQDQLISKWFHFKGSQMVELSFLDNPKLTFTGVIEVDKESLILLLSFNLGESITDIKIIPEADMLLSQQIGLLKDIKKDNEEIVLKEHEEVYKRIISEREKSFADFPKDNAIDFVVNSPYMMNFIWGPPGTGKTFHSVHIVKKLIEQKQSNLVLSISNQAVDNVMNELYEQYKSQDLPVVRIGNSLSKNKDIYEFFKPENVFDDQNLKDISNTIEGLKSEISKSDKVKDKVALIGDYSSLLISKKEIIASLIETNKATVLTSIMQSHVNKAYKSLRFDNVFLEECSMVNVPTFLHSLDKAKNKIIAVGDPKQLPPVCLSGRESLEKSPFEEFDIQNPKKIENNCFLLTESRRMPRKISDVVSLLYYDSKLLSNKDNTDDCVELVNLSGKAVNDANAPGSKKAAQILVEAILADDRDPEKVGIITPFRKQRDYIIAEILERCGSDSVLLQRVFTIHSAQGDGFDYVYFDTAQYGNQTRPNAFYSEPNISKRLLNVAVSRTKVKLKVFLDLDFIMGNSRQVPVLLNLIMKLSAN